MELVCQYSSGELSQRSMVATQARYHFSRTACNAIGLHSPEYLGHATFALQYTDRFFHPSGAVAALELGLIKHCSNSARINNKAGSSALQNIETFP